MGARDLLAELHEAGLSISCDGDGLVIRPASGLTEDMRAALVAAKPEVLAILRRQQRPYVLTQAESDTCHALPWNDAAIARFVARVGRFLRMGVKATNADDLAERLHLRDLEGDARVICLECARYRAGRCGNHRAAQLSSSDVSDDLAARLQRCQGFASHPL
jgi:hypothetical protein